MQTILFLLQKEFTQIFRNKVMIPIIFVLPIVQMVVLVYAATMEMKNINIAYVDYDMSSTSRQIQSKFEGSKFFYSLGTTFNEKEANDLLKSDEADVVLVFPSGMERDLIRENKSTVQVRVNAINGTKAGIANVYITSILQKVNSELVAEWMNPPKNMASVKKINITSSFWYNPELNYKVFMVPGILVILVTVIGMFLSALNLVREKEIGTIEQINVTPIKKYEFIISKLVPFWIIALFDLMFGLSIGKLLFHIPIEGSLFTLFTVGSLYLFVVLGLSLFLSTFAQTQQQVMFISFFFLIIFILMSGIFTSTESMPQWAKVVNHINPVFYFMRAIRMILLKGSGFGDILFEIKALLIYAVLSLSLAIRQFKKTA